VRDTPLAVACAEQRASVCTIRCGAARPPPLSSLAVPTRGGGSGRPRHPAARVVAREAGAQAAAQVVRRQCGGGAAAAACATASQVAAAIATAAAAARMRGQVPPAPAAAGMAGGR